MYRVRQLVENKILVEEKEKSPIYLYRIWCTYYYTNSKRDSVKPQSASIAALIRLLKRLNVLITRSLSLLAVISPITDINQLLVSRAWILTSLSTTPKRSRPEGVKPGELWGQMLGVAWSWIVSVIHMWVVRVVWEDTVLTLFILGLTTVSIALGLRSCRKKVRRHDIALIAHEPQDHYKRRKLERNNKDFSGAG